MISQWKKEAMRSSVNALKKNAVDSDKAAKAMLVQLVSDCQGSSSDIIIIILKLFPCSICSDCYKATC